MKKILITTALLTTLINATINIEPKNVSDANGWSADVGANAAYYTGNTEKSEYGINFRTEYGNGETYKHLLIGNYSYGESDDISSIENGKIHYRYTHKLSKKTDIEFFIQDEYDKFKNQKYNVGSGVNVRYSLINNYNGDLLFVGAGLMGTIENPYDITPKNDRREKIKANLYTMAKLNINKSTSISGIVFYQPIIANISDSTNFDTGDYTIDGTIALNTNLTNDISFVTSISYQRDSSPFEGVEEDDITLKFGLNYKIK